MTQKIPLLNPAIPCLIIALLPLNMALAAEEPQKPIGQLTENLRITGEFNGSYENWDYFQPKPASNNNNTYDLWVLRARLGVMFTSAWLDAYAQGQYIGMFGLPDNAFATPGGALGLGAAYFNANQAVDPDNVFLRQAYLNLKLNHIGLANTTLKVGRFEFQDGLEYKSGDAKFDGIKSARIAQRLIGSNAVHVTRTFDGFSAVVDQPEFNFTATGIRPTQGGFNVQGQDEISDIDVFYTALTSKKGQLLKNTEARLFYLNYNDSRNSQVVDNRPALNRPFLNKQALDLHTLGMHLLSIQPIGAGKADALLWGAYQLGDWAGQDQQAFAVDAEAGYQWDALPLKPWFRAVYNYNSGDGNPNDQQHQTFFSVLPSGRIFAKFPFYNLMNLEDAFLEMIVFPTPKTKITVDLHQLTLADPNDLFYGGLGATSSSGAFGYQGRPSGGNSEVGQMVDITFNHTVNRFLSWRFYYAHGFGSSVTQHIYQGKNDADMAYVDFNLVF